MSNASLLINLDGSAPSSGAGIHSLTEILSQPECWNISLVNLARRRTLEALRDRFSGAREWLFVGCGSSYYVAICAAATFSTLTGLRARALPASEILLYPEVALASLENCVPVLISRSGRTSEVVRAAELLKLRGLQTLAVTCTLGEPLEALASATISLPAADERSTVMTRSFTSMLLALQSLAALLAKKNAFSEALLKVPAMAAASLRDVPAKIRRFVDGHSFDDYVYLGQGPFYGLACEGALKVTEMSVSYAQAFHTLEFRHGPKSIVSPETLLVFLLSESGYQAEVEALEEMKSLGGTIVAVANHAEARVRNAADLVVELNLDLPETARLAPYLFIAQLIGLYTGLKKGMNPDTPRNLSRSVILDRSHVPA